MHSLPNGLTGSVLLIVRSVCLYKKTRHYLIPLLPSMELTRRDTGVGYRGVISTVSWGAKFFLFFNATGLMKNWKKQHLYVVI